jgi:hypothetical protein
MTMREDERLLINLYNNLSPEWQEEFWLLQAGVRPAPNDQSYA